MSYTCFVSLSSQFPFPPRERYKKLQEFAKGQTFPAFNQESMRNSSITGRIYTCLQHRCSRKFRSSSTLFCHMNDLPFPTSPKPGLYSILQGFKSRSISLKPTSNLASLTPFRQFNAAASTTDETLQETVDASDDSNGEVEPIDTWEEEDEAEPEVGDGGDGGGVALQNCAWGERVLSIAQEVLLEFGEDMKLYAFKTSPRGYIYVRLDKLSNEYGCPSMEEIELSVANIRKTG
ncbi:hypothetical protein ACS0TY_009850 [Phlomoides rotata]